MRQARISSARMARATGNVEDSTSNVFPIMRRTVLDGVLDLGPSNGGGDIGFGTNGASP